MEPDDTLAIKVGQLYLDTGKKQKIELEAGLNNLRDIEKQQEYEGKYVLCDIYHSEKSFLILIFRIFDFTKTNSRCSTKASTYSRNAR
jgi:hypothetical protein